MGTMDKLVEDLLRKPATSLRNELVRKALAGHYHDFKSELPLPKIALAADLERFGFRDLSRRAMRGEYDDDPDADDRAAIGRMLAENPALAEAWERMKETGDPGEAIRILQEADAKVKAGRG